MSKTAIILAIVVVLGAIFVLQRKSVDAPADVPIIPDTTSTSSPIINPGDEPPVVLPGGPAITVLGESECLPHKNTSGAITLECAFGIRADSGLHYGLDFRSYEWPPNFPTGERYRIEGILVPAPDSKYAIEGTITILKLERVN